MVSKRSWRDQWDERNSRKVSTHLIHACDVDEVSGCVRFCCDQHAVALSRREIDHVCCRWVGVNPVDFDDLHGVAFNPEVLAGKRSHVDNAEHVYLVGLYWSREILGIVEECSFRYRLGSGWIDHADESSHHVGHLIVVPV